MTTTAHGNRHVYSGATRPVAPRSSNANFDSDEPARLQMHDANRKPIPFIERCSYEEFLQHLANHHGDSYLCRPDGMPLQPRRPKDGLS